jgi:hypothetical protein
LVFACTFTTAAQVPRDPTPEQANVAGRLRQSELQELRPLFPHLGLAVLQDIKQLEQRPEGTPEEWADALRQRHACPAGLCRLPPRSLSETIEGRGGQRLSEDEKEVRYGGLQRRLIELAITGRITKEEYDGLVKRLQGN